MRLHCIARRWRKVCVVCARACAHAAVTYAKRGALGVSCLVNTRQMGLPWVQESGHTLRLPEGLRLRREVQHDRRHFQVRSCMQPHACGAPDCTGWHSSTGNKPVHMQRG